MANVLLLALALATKVVAGQSQCSSTPIDLYTLKSEITSPNYPNNYPNNALCRWRVTLPDPTGRVTYRYAGQFGIEASSGCTRDYLRIHDGPESFSPVVGTYCGRVVPPGLTVTGFQMFVEFSSDQVVNDTGFRLLFERRETACLSEVRNLTAAPGEFTTPFYPHFNYQDNSNCNWRIVAPQAETVELTVQDMSTEPCCDKVRIYDGANTDADMLGELSGDILGRSFSSSDRYMYVWFQSDSSINNRGFHMTYTFSGTVTEPRTETTLVMPTTAPLRSTPVPSPSPTNSPVLELTLNGTFHTDDGSDISLPCLDGYRTSLRQSASFMLLEINVRLAEELLCKHLLAVSVVAFDLSLSTFRNYGYTGLVYMLPAEKIYPFDTVADCAREVGVHMEDHNNWAQPIIGTPALCPAVVWQPAAFDSRNYRWRC